MVEGKLQIAIAQETYILQPGDAIHFTADRPHTYTNLSDHKAVYKTLIYYPSS